MWWIFRSQLTICSNLTINDHVLFLQYRTKIREDVQLDVTEQ